MRKLITADIPEAASVLKRIGVKAKLLDTIQRLDAAGSGADQISGGFELIWQLFDLATEAKAMQELYAFLARPFECSAAEVETMELTDLMDRLERLYTENNLSRFFGAVRLLMR